MGWLKGIWRRVLKNEKRRYPRVPLSVKITNATSGSFSYYHSSNISQGGLFLKCQEPLPVGTRLRLVFSLGDGEVEVEGKVVRVQMNGGLPAGMGVKFEKLSRQAREAIDQFLEKEI